MDEQKLYIRLEQFTPEYREVITGPAPKLLAVSFAKAFDLTVEEQIVLENSIQLYLVGLHDSNEWSDYLTKSTSLDQQTAQIVVDQILTHIADDIKMQIETLRAAVTENFDTPVTSPDAPRPSNTSKLPTRSIDNSETSSNETLPGNELAKVRTMHNDAVMQQQPTQAEANFSTVTTPQPPNPPPEEPTYVASNQADLLQRQPATPIPPKTQAEATPRWESEKE